MYLLPESLMDKLLYRHKPNPFYYILALIDRMNI